MLVSSPTHRLAVGLLAVVFAFVGACTPTPMAPPPVPVFPQAVKLGGEIFTSQWQVTIIARDAATLLRARTQAPAVEAALAEVERKLSLWQPESELRRFNAAAWTKPVGVTPGLATVLTTCLDVGAKTDGAFDITIGPLLDLWGLSAVTKALPRAVPLPADIARERARTGLQLLHIDSGGLKKDREDVVVDATAVGDGAAAAAVMAGLLERGFGDVLVDVAGEVVAAGRGLLGPWQVGVNLPAPDAGPDEVERVVELVARPEGNAPEPGTGVRALSTSGTYREAHILDPRTGALAKSDLVSCTIVADDVVVADALSTACIVLGEQGTRAILDRFPATEALFLKTKGERTFTASTTAGFPASRP